MTLRTLSICLFVAGIVTAQQKEITLDDVVHRSARFMPRSLSGLHWKGAGHFTYLKRTAAGGAWVQQSVADGTEVVIATAAEMKKAGDVPFGALGGATWNDAGTEARLFTGGGLYTITVEPLKVTKTRSIPKATQATAFSKDDTYIAYVAQDNIAVQKPDGSTQAVTHDGFEFLTYGQAVSRIEFGITDGLWWDPTGRRLAFYREDLRVIDEYPYIDWGVLPAKRVPGHYPMSGRRGSVVSVGVYDTRDDSVTWLKTDPKKDEYLTNVTWGPKGEKLYIAHVNRGQDTCQVHAWDAASGEHAALLFTEKDEEWVEPEEGLLFLPNRGDRFLWMSARDGYRHFYLYDDRGHVLEQLTRGDFDADTFAGFTPDGESFWFTTTGPDPRHRHLYRASVHGATRSEVGFEGEKDVTVEMSHAPTIPVTTGRGRHTAMPSPTGRHYLDRHDNRELAPVVDLLDATGRKIRRIHAAKDPLAGYRLGEHSFFTTKTADGQTMHGRLITPPGFDRTKKHPVLCYTYGGPHAQVVVDSYPAGIRELWFQYLANKGYVVYSVDNRGSGNRGIEWTQAIHREMSTLEVADQVKGLEYIHSLGFTDRNRVAVHGWSYGGYMTLHLMSRAADHFKVGISGAPVTDWKYYETGYTERYMDTPQENPDGYETASALTHVKGIKGRLLIVHGTTDETVVWQHTVDYMQKCIDGLVDVDYMIYPGQLHGLRGQHRKHLYVKMTNYLERELGRGGNE